MAGCSSTPDRYPSLAIRDAERVSGTLTPAADNAAEPVAPVTDARALSELVASANEGHQRFVDAVPAAAAAVERARGLSVESNAWSAAQIALADLNAHRSAALAALGDIDLLAAEAATSFAPTEEIREAQTKVRALVDEQSLVYSTLSEATTP